MHSETRDYKGIMLVAGHSPAGADGLNAVHHRHAFRSPFPVMPSVEMQQVPVPVELQGIASRRVRLDEIHAEFVRDAAETRR